MQEYNELAAQQSHNNESSDEIKEPESQNANEYGGVKKGTDQAGAVNPDEQPDPNQKLTFADMSASCSQSPVKDGDKTKNNGDQDKKMESDDEDEIPENDEMSNLKK